MESKAEIHDVTRQRMKSGARFATGLDLRLRMPEGSIRSEFAWQQFIGIAKKMTEIDFLAWVTMIFGSDVPEGVYRRLRNSLLDGTFPNPAIELTAENLGDHVAAYDGSRNMILVQPMLAKEALKVKDMAWRLLIVLIGEFGRHIDHILRTEFSNVGGDAPLHEGIRYAYAVVNFQADTQEETEFATYVTNSGEIELNVEHTAWSNAVKRWLDTEKVKVDQKSGSLEFWPAGVGKGKAGCSFGHESIEFSLEQAGFDPTERRCVYFGNWLRDFSQIVDPKITRAPKDISILGGFSRGALTRIVDVLAREKFGDSSSFRVDTAKLGVYQNVEHVDNPRGIQDASNIDPDFRHACLREELLIDPSTHLKRYIRSSKPGAALLRRPYKVRSGDTLESVAASLGMTWQQLAQFNFGTTSPDKVNDHLHDDVGCRKKTANGKNYVFTDLDSPGIIYLPDEGGKVGYETEVSYSALRQIRKELKAAIARGRTVEGYRRLGQALHTLEDFTAHSNFIEVSLVHLGYNVVPWVPVPSGNFQSTALPITTGTFGGADTACSLLLSIGETMQGALECQAGVPTTATKIALILLEDAEFNRTRQTLGAISTWLNDLEKKYPRLATLSCVTIDSVLWIFKYTIGAYIRGVGDQIDEAQAVFLNDPSSTDPTHSQLTKDHDDHPLHQLGAQLASRQTTEVAFAVQEAWQDKRTTDDVVSTAAQYLIHPSNIQAGGTNAWTLELIRSWAASSANRERLRRLSSPTWMQDWTQSRNETRKENLKRVDALDGGNPELRARVNELQGK